MGHQPNDEIMRRCDICRYTVIFDSSAEIVVLLQKLSCRELEFEQVHATANILSKKHRLCGIIFLKK